jgi:hypothetical protein
MAKFGLVLLALLPLSVCGGTLLKRASLQAPYDQQNCTTSKLRPSTGCCKAPRSSPAGTFAPATLCWQSDDHNGGTNLQIGQIFKVDAGSYGMYQISVNQRLHGSYIYGGFSSNMMSPSAWPLNGYYMNGRYSAISCLNATEEGTSDGFNMTGFYNGPLQAQVNKVVADSNLWFESSTYNNYCSSLYGRGGPFYNESVIAIPWYASNLSKVAAKGENVMLV